MRKASSTFAIMECVSFSLVVLSPKGQKRTDCKTSGGFFIIKIVMED